MGHNGATEDSSIVLLEQRHSAKKCLEGGGSHVTDATNQEISHPIRDVGVTTSFKPVSELLHEKGRVKELVGKIEENDLIWGDSVRKNLLPNLILWRGCNGKQ